MGVAISSHAQQADTGTKMIHLGENTKSTIISKGISAMKGVNAYRGLVRVGKKARNISECDSLLIGNTCKAHTYPYHEIKNPSAKNQKKKKKGSRNKRKTTIQLNTDKDIKKRQKREKNKKKKKYNHREQRKKKKDTKKGAAKKNKPKTK